MTEQVETPESTELAPAAGNRRIIEVSFKGNRKEFFIWDTDGEPPRPRGVFDPDLLRAAIPHAFRKLGHAAAVRR